MNTRTTPVRCQLLVIHTVSSFMFPVILKGQCSSLFSHLHTLKDFVIICQRLGELLLPSGWPVWKLGTWDTCAELQLPAPDECDDTNRPRLFLFAYFYQIIPSKLEISRKSWMQVCSSHSSVSSDCRRRALFLLITRHNKARASSNATIP